MTPKVEEEKKDETDVKKERNLLIDWRIWKFVLKFFKNQKLFYNYIFGLSAEIKNIKKKKFESNRYRRI